MSPYRLLQQSRRHLRFTSHVPNEAVMQIPLPVMTVEENLGENVILSSPEGAEHQEMTGFMGIGGVTAASRLLDEEALSDAKGHFRKHGKL